MEGLVDRIVRIKELRPFVSCKDLDKPLEQDQWDPYDNWCTILYKYEDASKPKIVGFVQYDNCLDILHVSRLNEISLPFKPVVSQHKPTFFYVPGLVKSIASPAVNLNLIDTRVNAILNNNDLEFDKAEDELGAFILTMFASTGSPIFDAMRINYERDRFMERVDREIKTEKDAVHLLIFNGFDKETLASITVKKGTLRDRRLFYDYHPTLLPPNIWFKVKLVDAPSLHHLPVYKGGYIHVSFLDVKYWLWDVVTERCRQMRTKYWLNPEDPLDLRERLWPFQKRIAQFKQKTTTTANPDTFVVDIESIPEMLPPCTRDLITTNRFPLHAERLALTSVFVKAGIAVESLGELLESLNEKYPQPGVEQSALKRWDYKYCYKKGYAPPRCHKLPECMSCPYSGDKEQCLQEFYNTHPDCERVADLEYFYGPYNWPKWVLFKRKKRRIKIE